MLIHYSKAAWVVGILTTLTAWAEPLRLEQLLPDDGETLRLTWTTVAGHTYELQESSDLLSWKLVAQFPTETSGSELHYDFSPEAERGFFRLRDLGASITPPPQQEAFFSVAGPTGQEIDLTLEEKIQELLDLAEPGSTVLASVYTWSRTNMADAFIQAYQRGVDVRLLVGSDYAAVNRLTAALPPGHVIVCRDASGKPNGCHGGGINHNKFFLFSDMSDGSTNVVVQSSANFTNPQIRSNNNLVIIRNDPALYEAYRTYWYDLYRQVDNLDYWWSANGNADTKAFFFPRNESNSQTGHNDTVVEILRELVAAPGSEIRVAMAFFTDARRGIAHRLVELQQEGFAVHVLVNPANTGGDIFTILENGGVSVTRYAPVHSKYMLVDHKLGRLRERFLLTGSHNFTSPALRTNDEVLLRMDNPEIYDAFLQDWHAMNAHPLAE